MDYAAYSNGILQHQIVRFDPLLKSPPSEANNIKSPRTATGTILPVKDLTKNSGELFLAVDLSCQDWPQCNMIVLDHLVPNGYTT